MFESLRIRVDGATLAIRQADVLRETNSVLAARFPRAVNVLIDDAAHFPWLEQSEAFSKAVLGFYRDAATT